MIFPSCFSSRAIRIPQKDIDTDLIIPAKYLRVTDSSGLAEGCFAEFKKDPYFPMNLPEFQDAKIIFAGANFGCGSSREHAPWALTQSGIHAVVSSAFADIFRGNAEKNALLPVVLSPEEMDEILASDSLSEVTLSLEDQFLLVEEKKYFFDILPFAKRRFQEGFSDTEYLQKFSDEIVQMASERKKITPSLS